jgi:hypothetical protein
MPTKKIIFGIREKLKKKIAGLGKDDKVSRIVYFK